MFYKAFSGNVIAFVTNSFCDTSQFNVGQKLQNNLLIHIRLWCPSITLSENLKRERGWIKNGMDLNRISAHCSIMHLNVLGFASKLPFKRLGWNKSFSHLSQTMNKSQSSPIRSNTLVLCRSLRLTTVRVPDTEVSKELGCCGLKAIYLPF